MQGPTMTVTPAPRTRQPASNTRGFTRLFFTLLGVATLVLTGAMTGCESTPQASPDDAKAPQLLADADAAYDRGEYVTAYRTAIRVANRDTNPDRYLAAYIAGMSTWKLRDFTNAEFYLDMARQSPDPQLAADARAALGLVYAEMGQHEKAVRELLAAVPKLTGNDRANAYLFAAISQQKLGQRPAARSNLILAQRFATDAGIRDQINELLGVTGYTLQSGAFSKEQNARKAAQNLAQRASSLNLGRTRILVVNREGRRFYRVQIGEFSSTDAANRARNSLRSATGIEAIITPLAVR